jgi:hypothetical protein
MSDVAEVQVTHAMASSSFLTSVTITITITITIAITVKSPPV